jgi:exodeoxyribonuclease VIII
LKKLKEGVNHVTNSEYHGDKNWLSSSNLKVLLKDRQQFHEEFILGNKRLTTGTFLDEGSYVHSLILEPHMVAEEYAISQSFHRRGPEWTSFVEQNESTGKILLSKAQDKRCRTYLQAFERNPLAVDLVKEGKAEYSICANIDGVNLKMRADWINVEEGYIADVKTSQFSVERDSFKMTMDKYKYPLSGALYAMIAEKHFGKPFDFYYIAISKSDLECRVFKTSEDTMSRGMFEVKKALSIYKECMETGNWDSPDLSDHKLRVGNEEIEEV